ncbi:uncharacterized protein EDB91DRAFT_292733 [Suillus paluster]|uniref:uncharacterized protein n=1 Tax=Suillus paluster TaxID=48578 RepID=UPI001B860A6B|nr:uncharacterized protein EDB91DRAFT_292733 [Suillus paluster]KAG1742702.1 hypothetical protein EDB91DRAFT_292733 [Suillus paluster]
MCPATEPRSCTGGASDGEPTSTAANNSTVTDSGLRTRSTLRRIPTIANLANLFASSKNQAILESPPTLDRESSSASVDTIRPLRSVHRLLGTSETGCPVPSSQHAAKSPTPSPSPTKSPSRKSGARRLQRSATLRLQGSTETDITSITSRIIQRLAGVPSNSDDSGDLQPASQSTTSDTFGKYALEDLNMEVRCYDRHVTTWDDPDHAFFIFPAQLLITCTSTCDFDPLVGPQVTVADLVCTTVAINGPNKSHRQISLKTFYDGATIRYVKDTPTPDVSRGIHIERGPWCSTMDGDGNFGWYMCFWIPIPFALFQRAETRAFKIDARVHVNGDEGKEGHLIASSEFTLSRLLRGLAM